MATGPLYVQEGKRLINLNRNELYDFNKYSVITISGLDRCRYGQNLTWNNSPLRRS